MCWEIPHRRWLRYRNTENKHQPSTIVYFEVTDLIQVNRVINIVHVKILKGGVLKEKDSS